MTIFYLFRELPEGDEALVPSPAPQAEHYARPGGASMLFKIYPNRNFSAQLLKKIRDIALRDNKTEQIFKLDIPELGNKFHCAAIYSRRQSATMCIVSDTDLSRNSLTLLVRNMFDQRNALEKLATDERFLREFVDYSVESAKFKLFEAHKAIADTIDRAKSLARKSERFKIDGGKIESISEAAENFADNAKMVL